MAYDELAGDRFGDLHVTPEAIRSVHARVMGSDLAEAVRVELTQIMGTLPHVAATEPVVLT